MSTVWPATLPPPASGTFKYSPAKNKIRSDMDKGPAKQRRRTSANTKPISFELALTGEQADILTDFHDDDCFAGSVSFTFTDPKSGDTVEARFVDEPQISHIESDEYRASVNLEIMP